MKPNYALYDTYEADLLNEIPPRREEITEIQDRDEGDLLCYASPRHADIIVRAVNNHEALVYMLKRLAEKVRRANSIQHSGGPVLPEDWAELFNLQNEAFALIENATK